MDPLQAYLNYMAGQPQGGLPVSQQGMPSGPGWVNPAELQGGALPAAAAGGSPYWRAMIAAAGAMAPTPTASNDQAPTNMWNQRPSGVADGPWHIGGAPSNPIAPRPSAGDDNGYNNPMQAAASPGVNATIPPFTVTPPPMPARPTSTGAMPPAATVSATPQRPARSVSPPSTAARGSAAPAASSNNKKIDPKGVDLGNTRFTTFHYQVPNSARNAPIYTALNFGG
jgi:hypothetical protein